MNNTNKSLCAYCVNSPLRPSRHKGLKDLLMKLAGKRPARCPACEKRFYVSKTQPLQTSRNA